MKTKHSNNKTSRTFLLRRVERRFMGWRQGEKMYEWFRVYVNRYNGAELHVPSNKIKQTGRKLSRGHVTPNYSVAGE